MKSGTCPKCQSTRIMKNVSVPDYHSYALASPLAKRESQVQVEANPGGRLFNGAVSASYRAWICADCGLMEQYVYNTKVLWEAYKKANPSA